MFKEHSKMSKHFILSSVGELRADMHLFEVFCLSGHFCDGAVRRAATLGALCDGVDGLCGIGLTQTQKSNRCICSRFGFIAAKEVYQNRANQANASEVFKINVINNRVL
jgi:hypothetical protein